MTDDGVKLQTRGGTLLRRRKARPKRSHRQLTGTFPTAGDMVGLWGEDMANITDAGAPTQLFPILSRRLPGGARMVRDSAPAGEGHLVEFRTLAVRSVLNRSVSKRRLSLSYSINPYRGCEFGCRYCYARYTHEFLAAPAPDIEHRSSDGDAKPLDLRDPEAFERRIFVKQNAPWLLEQELRRVREGEEIALGTATDPYQPAERWAKITRGILEVFARRCGHRLGIVTKSTLIERDIDLLQQIASRNTLVVHLTITTPDAGLARKLEPRAPRPDLRLAAVRRLRSAGLTTGILCSPLLPGITDGAEAIDAMAGCAADAGASFFSAEPLFLKPCSQPTYLQFVHEHFPALEAATVARFAVSAFANSEYRGQISRHVTAACRRHGLPERSGYALLTTEHGNSSARRPPRGTAAQGDLFGEPPCSRSAG